MSYLEENLDIGINRNIMECKEATSAVKNVSSAGINRNIMECKDREDVYAVNCAFNGINRNIMECKALYHSNVTISV